MSLLHERKGSAARSSSGEDGEPLMRGAWAGGHCVRSSRAAGAHAMDLRALRAHAGVLQAPRGARHNEVLPKPARAGEPHACGGRGGDTKRARRATGATLGNSPLCSIALQARLTPRRLPACGELDARFKLPHISRAQRACFALACPACARVDRQRRSDGARLATASRVTTAVRRPRRLIAARPPRRPPPPARPGAPRRLDRPRGKASACPGPAARPGRPHARAFSRRGASWRAPGRAA